MKNKGFTLVEFLSMCPTGWRVSTKDSLRLIDEDMSTYFPLGVYKDIGDK